MFLGDDVDRHVDETTEELASPLQVGGCTSSTNNSSLLREAMGSTQALLDNYRYFDK
jgi:hypothetical protein